MCALDLDSPQINIYKDSDRVSLKDINFIITSKLFNFHIDDVFTFCAILISDSLFKFNIWYKYKNEDMIISEVLL